MAAALKTKQVNGRCLSRCSLPDVYDGPNWLPQQGWHKVTWAASLMVGRVGQYLSRNENTPVFNLSSSVCPQIC